jgi:hypothetical protein
MVVLRLWVLDPAMGYLPPLTRKRKYDAIARQAKDLAMGKTPTLGPYLKAYDPDGNGGAGTWELTDDKAQAMRFADEVEATECWRAQSTVVPLRIDGNPNRPLTQFNVTIENG